MRAKAYPLLEQTIEDGVRFYLLNRVNKYVKQILWYRQTNTNGEGHVLSERDDIERHVREIAEEAAEHIMTCVSEAFVFTDDEAVVPQEEERVEEPPGGEYHKYAWQDIGAYDQGRTDGENRIIAFLEQQRVDSQKAVEVSVDCKAWDEALIHARRADYLEFLIDRIKSEKKNDPRSAHNP